MAAEFQLSILTPEKTLFEGPVEYVEVPGMRRGALAGERRFLRGRAEQSHGFGGQREHRALDSGREALLPMSPEGR
jgi:hypothetical protein